MKGFFMMVENIICLIYFWKRDGKVGGVFLKIRSLKVDKGGISRFKLLMLVGEFILEF